MATAETAVLRMREKRLYLIAAILFALIVLVGFGRTYYLKPFTSAPPLASWLVVLHGILMSAWVVLFIAQVFFIRTKKIRVHQRLGYTAVALAAAIIVVGFFTAIAAARNGAASFPAEIPRLSFLAVPLFDLIMFSILFGAAVYYRKKAADHKRLMLLTAINFIPPAVARFPIPGWFALGPIVFFGVPIVLLIFALVYDRMQNGKFNKIFVYGSLLLVASYPLRLAIMGTDAWLAFASWLTGFSLV